MNNKRKPYDLGALAHALEHTAGAAAGAVGDASHAVGHAMFSGMHEGNQMMQLHHQLTAAGLSGQQAYDVAASLVYYPYRGKH